ncbi:GNAT family N-acetyltransferase [Novosphingobium cyanobacteriorum]|uniref:GNAT family N-acetyltransferase n=1 Tax=Novosphingobium cyanobacteriorum TaxID=3024215 RepID=A0ABT6CKF4_9SPHN|nr:GNAT family N-acetyltransferase [Novosphingobium cyanobacteriorum]MDF8333555.1 GNAT family N-acetyltransferase [Novosphingobium cyanobacteriorum]
MELRTARLLLRPARSDDVDPLHAIMRQPRTMAYWSTPPHESPEQTADFVTAMMEIPDGQGEDFVVEWEGRVIGKAGLYRFPDIGYLFDPAVWGQGFAQEALRAVIGRAFTVHALPRIQADVDPRNAASIRLLGRLGFHETHRQSRTWLVGEEWCDSVYFALLREDFQTT